MSELDAYREKRDFESTPEPPGEQATTTTGRRFVIQKHAARRLHYDLRLEHDGVLLSWAIPKGPSLDPRNRRLAIRTEDHPVDYAEFEGTIPAGQYGGGRVLVWDRGVWIPEGDPVSELARGHLVFSLRGEKLHGRWNLIRFDDHDNWLLMKSRDEFARSDTAEIVDERPRSVVSGRSIEELGGRPPPPTVAPQLATPVVRPPAGSRWLHEIKLDGYRILAHVGADGVRLRTRGGEDWTAKLPELRASLVHPALYGSVLDGELCWIDPDGVSSFDRLQQALAAGQTAELVYSVFDLPFHAGEDLRRTPLVDRKRTLASLLAELDTPRVRYWSHVIGSGHEVFERACALGAEGVVSKRVDAIYEERRTRTWLKAKCPRQMTVVAGGFTSPQGSRRGFGALLVGTFDADGRLRYRGKVGAGFSDAALTGLHAKLQLLRRPEPAFVDPRDELPRREVTWVEPVLEVDVAYGELSDKGRLRQARFRGTHVQPTATHANASPPTGVRLTHPDRLLFPDALPHGLSKRDVADYVMAVAEWMLPHVRGRPLTLVRCPDGVGGDCFYQKHAMPGLPASVERVTIPGAGVYASVRDALGLVGLVQMSVLEIHPWSSTTEQLERPDRLIFDLDPDVELDFVRVVDAALEVRDRLAALGLRSFVKTTGGKGLHVVVPIAPRLDFDRAKQFCRALARRMVDDSPDRYTAVMAKAERHGKVFVDYLRNARGATSVAPYSLRAKPDARVSTPLAWDELGPGLRPERFDATTVPARLAELDEDPWADMLELRQVVANAARS